MRCAISCLIVLLCLAHRAHGAGAGFEEVPEPDEFFLSAPPAPPARWPRVSLSAGPLLVLPQGEARTFARRSVGVSAWWARWLTPHLAFVVTAEQVSLDTRPIVPSTAGIGWYAIGAGLRAASGRTRMVHVYAQTDLAQHVLQVASEGWTRSSVAPRLRVAAGIGVRLAHDLELSFGGGYARVQTSLGSGRQLQLDTATIQLTIGWRQAR